MKDFTVENNDANISLVYQIDKNETLDMVALEMIEHNKIPGLLEMIYTQKNESKLLKYNITSKITLEQLLERNVNKEMIVKCFMNLLNTIISAEDYLLEQNEFIMDKSKIYINVGTYDIGLIYLPVKHGIQETNLEQFFKNIIFTSKFDETENCEYVAKIISFLNRQVFSIFDFRTFLYELVKPNQNEEKTVFHKTENSVHQGDTVKEVTTTVDVFAKNRESINSHIPAERKELPDTKVVEQSETRHNTNQELNIPGKPANAMISPLQNDGRKTETVPVEPQKQKKNNKKAGLFGGFGKKNKDKPNQQGENITIPKSTIPANAVVQNNVEPQKSPLSTSTVPAAGFGETVVLNAANIGETAVLSANPQNNPVKITVRKAYLIRQRNSERIVIDKEVFRVGKEKSYVDYFISDNTAISRSHASIIRKNDKFFIVDTNSKNHTYVDGLMIQPNIEVAIQTGSRVRLADEDFVFEIN